MSISTFAELKTAIANWMDVSSAQFATNQLDDLVMLGEKWINRNIRNEDMETALSGTISSGTIAAPTGFIGLKYAYVDGSPAQPLIVKTPAQIIAQYPQRSSAGKPVWIGYDAGSFIFGPYPDSNYTVKLTCYTRQGPLSSSVYNLFTNNPDLFLFAALAEAEMVVGRDPRVVIWKAKRDEIARAVNAEAQGIMGAGGMAITVA